jgi:hypothetical protein
MKNEFVKYEQALALKELGYDEYCFGVYLPDIPNNVEIVTQNVLKEEVFTEKGFIKAPLYQQAMRWFKEVKGINFNINITYSTFDDAMDKQLRKLIGIVKEKDHENN